MSYSVFRGLSNSRDILEAFLQEYCQRRRRLYDRLGYSNVVVQALYDSGVSRKKGTAGISELIGLIQEILGEVPHVKDIVSLIDSPLCYFLPDKGDKKLFIEFRRRFGIKYAFGEKHQGKTPDLVLKVAGHFFIVEAKHVKEAGGAQDKQVLEAIEFIRYSEERDDIHYVSFMDGLYFNKFVWCDEGNSKVGKQKRDIELYLKENGSNFFVNTSGFKAILKDIKKR